MRNETIKKYCQVFFFHIFETQEEVIWNLLLPHGGKSSVGKAVGRVCVCGGREVIMSSSAVHFIAIKMLTPVRPLTSFLPFCVNLKQQELDFKR